MSAVTANSSAKAPAKKVSRFNRWDSPWLSTKFLSGCALLFFVLLLSFGGPLVWDRKLALVGSSELNRPPMWMKGGTSANSLGAESNGRDILATIIEAPPL